MNVEKKAHSNCRRSLIYIAAKSQPEMVRRLDELGWNTFIAENLRQANDICCNQNISVGLIEISDPEMAAKFLPQLVNVVESDLNWIALISPLQLQYSETLHTISQFCYDFVTTPIPFDRLAVTIGRAHGMRMLVKKKNEIDYAASAQFGIIGSSNAIKTVRHNIATFAASDAPVLIVGETGTGKELAASAIHALSRRGKAPLVAVNCGALQASLIQSELFGYEKGAFTGADRRVIGKLEAANTGTIFLDEIGELPSEQQVNLLRVLQEHRVQRVGGHAEVKLDLRVIAATNADLEQAVQDGRFREDLYYRLNVLLLSLPPLRDRIEDIEILAHYTFKTYFHERIKNVRDFSQDALTAMRLHTWPGNVRELINRVRRALITCERPLIGVDDLGLDSLVVNGAARSLNDARSRAEYELACQILRQTGGNVSEAARRLNVTRATLYRLIRKYDISPGAAVLH
ncbi:sigma-54-dependent transcriptional regulator [Allochromatium vinosum]|uniref:sigma-54-dependent transcriptional regulator n=1 Tax=Allochromatium vinosum TaxID=1049 RepID=UPI001905EF17|nr:sigma-54 dependent transcriptional regulator [Allochromatium vinosum]MBK1656166.1 sigma-54-dependent Fis family transcriptional regulator [Allochromatium vinosum]